MINKQKQGENIISSLTRVIINNDFFIAIFLGSIYGLPFISDFAPDMLLHFILKQKNAHCISATEAMADITGPLKEERLNV